MSDNIYESHLRAILDDDLQAGDDTMTEEMLTDIIEVELPGPDETVQPG